MKHFWVRFSVSIYCGQTSMENCTYFESNKIYPGGCKATICPCGKGICQASTTQFFFAETNELFIWFFFALLENSCGWISTILSSLGLPLTGTAEIRSRFAVKHLLFGYYKTRPLKFIPLTQHVRPEDYRRCRLSLRCQEGFVAVTVPHGHVPGAAS